MVGRTGGEGLRREADRLKFPLPAPAPPAPVKAEPGGAGVGSPVRVCLVKGNEHCLLGATPAARR